MTGTTPTPGQGCAESFWRGVGGQAGAADGADQVAAFVHRAAQPWPQLQVDDNAFMLHVGQRVADSADPLVELASLEASDLYLAYACLADSPGAIDAFELEHGMHISSAHRRMGQARPPIDELRQRIREHAFVPRPTAPAAIASYSGRGPLGAWFRITATRVAMGMMRKQGRDTKHASAAALIATEVLRRDPLVEDPELRVLYENCQDALREAVMRSTNNLSSRQRALLRLSFGDRHSVRQIGAMYGVHHATAARWVKDAYAALVDGVRAELRAGLGVTAGELQSILRVVRSHLDLTLSRVLGDEPPA